MGSRTAQEIKDFIEAFRAGNEMAYKWQYLKLQQRQLQMRDAKARDKALTPMQRNAPTFENGREQFYNPGPGSENTTPEKSAVPTKGPGKVAPTKTAEKTESEVKPVSGSQDAQPQSSTPKSGGGDHTPMGDEPRRTAAIDASSMSDASNDMRRTGGFNLPAQAQTGATPKLARFDAGKAPSYLDAIAQKHGIDPTDFKRMAWIESKFDPNARSGASSAGGLFQFTDETARNYGLKNKFDGVANAEAAARLWNDNKAGLTQALGRAPTAGELYLAHQQGLGGAKSLLSNPNASAASIVGHKAVVNNGGSANMSARDFSNMWTGRFDNIGNEAGTTPRSTGNAPATPAGNQAVNTRQRTAVDAGTMSDASNDIRRTGGVTPASSTGAQYSPGANPEGKTFKEAYNESIKNAQPAASTSAASAVPATTTTAAASNAAPPGTHYVDYGPNRILIDDKTGAPVQNLKGWEHASEPAKAINGDNQATPAATTPQSAVPTEPAKTEAPEFPNNKAEAPPAVDDMRRPEELKSPEPTQPASADAAQPPAAEQSGATQQGNGGDFFGDLFNLDIPADWDVAANQGGVSDIGDFGGDIGGGIGDALGGLGDALGGIGDAIGGALGGLFANGGMVRRYEDGGEVDLPDFDMAALDLPDEEPASAVPMPASRQAAPARAPMRQAAPQQDQGGDVFGSIMDGFQEAIRGGLSALQEMFGLTPEAVPQQGVSPQGVRALMSGAGAISDQEKQAIRKTVDPHDQLSEGMANIAGYDAVYRQLIQNGDVKGAREVAAGMIQHTLIQSQRLGALAAEALRNGDTGAGAKALVQAYNIIPNGRQVSVEKGEAVIKDVKTGQVVEKFELTPQKLMAASLHLASGSGYFDQVANFASGKNGMPAGAVGLSEQDENDRYSTAEKLGQPIDMRGMSKDQMRSASEHNRNMRWEKNHEDSQKRFEESQKGMTDRMIAGQEASEKRLNERLDRQDKAREESDSRKETMARRQKEIDGINKMKPEEISGIPAVDPLTLKPGQKAPAQPSPEQIQDVRDSAKQILQHNDVFSDQALRYGRQITSPRANIKLEAGDKEGRMTMPDGEVLTLPTSAFNRIKRIREGFTSGTEAR